MIDVAYLPFVSGGIVSATSGGVFTVPEGGQSYTEQLAGSYASEVFGISRDTGGGTLITAKSTVACYRRGTRILTDRGERPVEDLRVGDLVRTIDGAAEPIVWIGRRDVVCARHPNPRHVWPVRVAAGAFGESTPHRALYLSPDHAVFVNGVLIPGKTPDQRHHHCLGARACRQLLPHRTAAARGRAGGRAPRRDVFGRRRPLRFRERRRSDGVHRDFTARLWEARGCAPLVVTGGHSRRRVRWSRVSCRRRRNAALSRGTRNGQAAPPGDASRVTRAG